MTPSQAGATWFWNAGGQRNGPVSLADLQAMLRTRRLSPQTMVWTEGMPEWLPAARLPVLLSPQWNNDGEAGAVGLLLPMGPQSGLSIAAGYCGLVGLLVVPIGVIAVVLGLFGIRDLKAHPAKRGWGRAITGIVAGGISVVVWTIVLVAVRHH